MHYDYALLIFSFCQNLKEWARVRHSIVSETHILKSDGVDYIKFYLIGSKPVGKQSCLPITVTQTRTKYRISASHLNKLSLKLQTDRER